MYTKLKIFATAGIVALSLLGCSSSSTMVLHPNKQLATANYQNYMIKEVVIANNVPQKQRAYFQQKLQSLITKKGFHQGKDLTLKYSFLTYNEGNRFSRYMLGGLGGAGKGELVVKVEYYNRRGKKVGEIQSKGELGAGVFGGSFQGTLDKVAEEISEYTLKNYLHT